MLNIHIQTIPHNEHRYETVGDWWQDPDGTLQIRVSDMANAKYELLVALHEMIEQQLCNDRKITDEVVSAFDREYEADREKGLHTDDEEPGDDPAAPYFKEHAFATQVEMMMAEELGVDWDAYAHAVMTL